MKSVADLLKSKYQLTDDCLNSSLLEQEAMVKNMITEGNLTVNDNGDFRMHRMMRDAKLKKLKAKIGSEIQQLRTKRNILNK